MENQKTDEKEEVLEEKISIDEFKKVEIRIGEIKSAEKIIDADRLLKLSVSFGNETRQIVSGIAEYFPEPQILVGKKVPFVTNLKSRKIKGLESEGMILAVIDRETNAFDLPQVGQHIPSGTKLS